MKAEKIILIGAIVGAVLAFGLLQFWPLQLSNPPIVSQPDWQGPQTQVLAQQACFDCHSNETVWPWYARVRPFGMLLEQDVLKGREVLNFSQWQQTCCTESQIDDMAETVNSGEMPLPYYIILHPEADLNSEERGELVNGLLATMELEID